ncbi:ABC transporter substrate-binding protein [Pelomonas sp. KK5]|uniref:ABC transporter substrate-binding protein n=1 Tax=Pelomonas sp. KK5 TaxID=1855730 RepID=UPI00097BD129|nr:ABC transporter substrate-binding protein [Pelomonas sp. KK5]
MNLLKSALAAAGLALPVVLANAQTPPLKIGFLATLSGPFGTIGQDQADAFMLAVEQRGGRLGGVPVEVIKEDDQAKPERAVQLAQKLVEGDKVPIVTGITAASVMVAVARPVIEKQVFLLSTNSGPSPFAGAGCSPYLYVVSWQGDYISEVVGKYASDKGIKKMALIAPNYSAGKDVLAGFKRFYKGQVTDEFLTPTSQLDFSAEIAQIQANRPDAVFAFLPGALSINFTRQYQQAGLLKTLPLLTSGMIEATNLPALKDQSLGILGGAFWGPDFDNPANKAFVEAFEKKYGRIPSTYAAQAYDGALLLDSAIAKVKGNVTGDKPGFMAAMKAADFRSVRGKFRFNHNGFPVEDMHMFEAVKDAKGRYTVKTVATPLRDHEDNYHAACALNS